ncbi:MAG: universal stress protein, partial [Thermodesulfobacteriota bacterium]|nr:universal stress protein [Thermodesulfobacteriota bacterium]
MKTILVPTDFSEHALNALKVAAQVAKKINAKIVLAHVNVFPTSEYAIDVSYQKYYRQNIAEAEKKLNDLAELDFLKGIELSKHFA